MKRMICFILVLVVLSCTACSSSAPEAVPTWQDKYESGMQLFQDGQIDEALAEFEAGIELDDAQPDLYLAYGDMLLSIGQEESNVLQAIEFYGKAIALDTSNPETYLKQAEAYLSLDKTEEALACLKNGSEALPDNEAISSKLSEIRTEIDAKAKNASLSRFLGKTLGEIVEETGYDFRCYWRAGILVCFSGPDTSIFVSGSDWLSYDGDWGDGPDWNDKSYVKNFDDCVVGTVYVFDGYKGPEPLIPGLYVDMTYPEVLEAFGPETILEKPESVYNEMYEYVEYPLTFVKYGLCINVTWASDPNTHSADMISAQDFRVYYGNQILGLGKVIVDELTLRGSHSTKAESFGFAWEGNIYPIYDTYNDGQYTWYKIFESSYSSQEQWIADLNGEWVIFYPIE